VCLQTYQQRLEDDISLQSLSKFQQRLDTNGAALTIKEKDLWGLFPNDCPKVLPDLLLETSGEVYGYQKWWQPGRNCQPFQQHHVLHQSWKVEKVNYMSKRSICKSPRLTWNRPQSRSFLGSSPSCNISGWWWDAETLIWK